MSFSLIGEFVQKQTVLANIARNHVPTRVLSALEAFIAMSVKTRYDTITYEGTLMYPHAIKLQINNVSFVPTLQFISCSFGAPISWLINYGSVPGSLWFFAK